jgi:hypothetical protein
MKNLRMAFLFAKEEKYFTFQFSKIIDFGK